MRCKNCDTRLLSEDALTVSMVIRVMSLLGRQTTRCMSVACRAVLILSLTVTTDVVRGEPSRLMIRRRSRCVIPFLGGVGCLAAGWAAGAAAGGLGTVEGFLALYTTCAHDDGAGAGGGRGAAGAGWAGPGVDPGTCGCGGGRVAAAAVREPTISSAVVRRSCNRASDCSVARRASRSVWRSSPRKSSLRVKSFAISSK